MFHRADTWKARIEKFGRPAPPPQKYDLDKDAQVAHANIAIVSSGIIGKGPGQSTERDFLSQAFSDFIYAIIIEETGLVGGMLVLLLYSFFYFRCVRLAWRCNGRFGALTVAGLGTMIYLQALANMGVAVGVLPVTGQTLPFISYGGTAYLFLSLGMGIIQSVAAGVYADPKPSVDGGESAVADTTPDITADEEMQITDDTEKQ
jgi:cell division protein FtsW